jgi:hypothetical protein
MAISLIKRDNSQPSARILFNGFESQATHTGSIHFLTRTTGGFLTERAYFGPDGHFRPSADNTYLLGSSSNRWKEVWPVDGTVNTSDARLKRDIRGLPDGLGRVMRLRPVTFSWKEDAGGRQHAGLLAQEVEGVVPEAVRRGEGPRATLGLSYAEITPVLIKAVQEQQTQIQEQQKQIEQLRTQLTRQQAQLNRMRRSAGRKRAVR